ncbi:hypothetical protein F5I97DRAFT_1929500 [Phlebopus sp. FC_14]|nr:hypothetical protein F5I97DRAFT_1929500 [Phlebopus sp. FC_14]
MRPQMILAHGLAALLFTLGVSASLSDSGEPEILIEAAFPESNPFGHVINGERNQIFLLVENKSGQNLTLQTVGGSFHHPESGILVKNTTSLTYGLRLLEDSKLQIPYTFYSEFKPGDLRLNIWLEHTVEDEKYRVTAYDSVVTIVEPESSWFDFKLITTYFIVLAFLGGISYYVYLSYVPASKTKKTKRPEASTSVATVTVTGVSSYEEEWIPEHHLKKSKSKKTPAGALSSGEEVSGGETSGTEGRKRKGKK